MLGWAMKSRLNLVVAHKLEAQPLVAQFALKQISASPLVYENTSGLRLIVSGQGREASAAAVAQLFRVNGQDNAAAWLNIGIAGHQTKAVGEALLANKIVNCAGGSTIYPVPVCSGLLSGEVHTVDVPETSYPNNVAYEMEAAGFFAAAAPLTSIELVQCLKIISDNAQQGTDQVSKELVEEVISANAELVGQCIEEILELQDRYQKIVFLPDEYHHIAAHIHLTATQKNQVKRLCQRYNAFGLLPELAQISKNIAASGRDLVQQLESGLQRKE